LLPLRPITARTFVTRTHLCATIASIAAFFLRCASTRTLAAVLAARARIAAFCTTIASTGPFLIADKPQGR
jgi:hypothetical protein